MSIPKSQLDRIIDSVERMLDKVGKSYVDSGDCDLETFTQQLMPEKPQPFSDGTPQLIHGEGKKDLFK